jgi:CheY-like chemotaxis protein
MHAAASLVAGERVLVASPDGPLRRGLLRGLHRELGLVCDEASHGARALDALRLRRYDLAVLSSELAGIAWFDLVQFLRENRPDTKAILYTGKPVEEHLELALEYDISTILSQHSPHPLRDGVEASAALLSGDIFGLERWLGPSAEIFGRQLQSSSEILPMARLASRYFKVEGRDRIFFRALTEILTNAVYYGSLGEDGARKSEWIEDVSLGRDQGVYLFWGRSERSSGCSVVDLGGRLEKNSVLRWLLRQRQQVVGGLMLGTALNHGRGLSITRRSIDRLLINTRRGDRTEIILLNLPEGTPDTARPLLIHEV